MANRGPEESVHEIQFWRGRFRVSTATCCRRARTSRAVSLRLRKNTRIPTMNERMNFKHELTLVTRLNAVSSDGRSEIASC